MSDTATKSEERLTAARKALLVNLDKRIFGTFAEIGAGQEVARMFFRVGGAAGTIAKTISAYDMTFSDEIYGRAGRYVSRERLISMLKHEYMLLLERLSSKRGADTTFFVLANTVAARNFQGTNECHGWLGVRFQSEPSKPPSDIIIHMRMLDRENLLQQQALGIIGANLLYGAFFERQNPEKFISSLIDDLSVERIEVDMIEFLGPDFAGVDNRLQSLRLVQHSLTNAVMFAPDGQVLQPSEVLYKRPILVERGSFRPVTHVNLDMMKAAREDFMQIPGVRDHEPVFLFEIALHNLAMAGDVDDADFLARADTISALGYTVLISNYPEYYRLTNYFRRYTKEPLGMVVGINTLLQIFDEHYYTDLDGGILEALGRLFKQGVGLYVYPMTKDGYLKYISTLPAGVEPPDPKKLPNLITAQEVSLLPHLAHLYRYLLEANYVHALKNASDESLNIFSREVLNQIRSGDPAWEKSVPPAAARIIKERGMFKK